MNEDRLLPRSRPVAPITPIKLPQVLPILVQNNVALAQKPQNLPPAPQIVTPLTGISGGFEFTFKQVTIPPGWTNAIASYRVYRNIQANNISGAFIQRTFPHDPTSLGAITFQDSTGSGKTYYYFVACVDTYGQQSLVNPAQSGPVTSL